MDIQRLFLLGRPFGPLYGLIMGLRAWLYARGVFTSHRLSVPVVSIGNVVLGGSGKTPMVRYLAEFFLELGLQPAIISRGYGGKAKGLAAIVSDGKEVLLPPREGGDEPCMLAESLPKVPVVVGRRRIHPCRLAISSFHADVLLLDDGFQHLSVRRDLDLVLFDATTLAGDGRVFPAGILREPLLALKRADAMVLTGVGAANRQQAENFADSVRALVANLPIFMVSLAEPELRWVHGSPASTLPAFAFCGIANPVRFRQTIDSLGISVAGFLALPDHVRYERHLVEDIHRQAAACGAAQLLTTSKDYVKLRNLPLALPLAVIDIKMEPQPELRQFLRHHLKDHFPQQRIIRESLQITHR